MANVENLFEFYGVTIVAVILLGLAKGGFSGVGLLSLPLMALVLSPLEAAAMMLPILLMQDMVGVFAYRRHWDGGSLKILLPSALVGVFGAYLLVSVISDSAIQLGVGLISIGFGTHQLLRRFGYLKQGRSSLGTAMGLVCGLCGGFASMLAQAGGPPMQIFLLMRRLDRKNYVGTMAMLFAVINLFRLPAFLSLGALSNETIQFSLALMPLGIASSVLGIYISSRINGETFFVIINAILTCVGAKLIFDGYYGI